MADLDLKIKTIPHFGVKQAVFPFPMFPEVDPLLGPEMRSTGEVLGIDDSLGIALFKAEEATQQPLPAEGTVLITVADKEKGRVAEVARQFYALGFTIIATEGTHTLLTNEGIPAERIFKMHEGRPNIADGIKNGTIQLIINTPVGKQSQYDDSYIRKAAIKHKIPYITTLAGAFAAVKGITAYRKGDAEVRSLQRYHAAIK